MTSDRASDASPDSGDGPTLLEGAGVDDVLARRARLKRITSFGQRTGYGLYLASLIGGVIGIRWGYTPLLSTLIAVAFVVGSMLLLPTIVMGYGIKAAEREERQAAAASSTE